MNISRITYFNIGNSADEGQDFFDVLKAGFAIFYGEEAMDLIDESLREDKDILNILGQ